MIEIVPAILTNSSEEFEKYVKLIEPYSKRIHLDVGDGIFVPNETISGYQELEIVPADIKFDVHLMIQDPLIGLLDWNRENVNQIIVHLESKDPESALKQIKNMNKAAGLAIHPDTAVSDSGPLLGLVDFVHFMTVNPGFQGGEFIDQVVLKIKNFHKMHPKIKISVDGGINPATAKMVVDAGADILVSGSFILKSGNVGKAIEELHKISENK